MWRVYAAIVLAWVLLMPPLLTDGACASEFNAEAARIETDMPHIRTYDGRLARIATDMDPFKSLPIPFTNITVHWAR